MAESVLRTHYMVKPSECNAEQQLPLSMLVSQMIDLATDHANQLGIGFLILEPRGLGWVLSRLSIEMSEWPKNGEKYTLATWVETYNQHFSERCFSVVSEDGKVLGYARTVWMIIDLKNHESVGTANTILPEDAIPGIECPIPKFKRMRHFEAEKTAEYVFKYTDLDFYRHVNTVRYISLLQNQITLEEFDKNTVSRFDIGFAHEAKYGEKALIKSKKEKVPAPGLMGKEIDSEMHTFEISIEARPILTASIVLTQNS